MFFQLLEINEKKKNFGVQTVFGLLPNYIVEKKNLYCNIEIVLQAIGEKAVRLCCNTIFCIVTGKARLEGCCIAMK